MSLRDIFSSGLSKLHQEGPRTVVQSAVRIGASEFAEKTNLYQGKSIMSMEWDLFIILDACRPDALEAAAKDFDFVSSDIESKYSVGSASDQWMTRTFTDEYDKDLKDTVYVTANPNSEGSIITEQFQRVDEVWKTAYDPDLGTTPPKQVTKHAINAYRKETPERLLVHYMQPHFPSIPKSLGFGIRKGATDPDDQDWIWSGGPPNKYTPEELWNAYSENLKYVLQDVSLLLDNINANTAIISSDHGNAFGEWGIWGHPPRALPILREVPWVETRATDKGTLDPEINSTVPDSHSVEEKLRALGYKE